MKATVIIQGREHLSLAAVPYVTDGFLSEGDVVHMLADPEVYCDHEHDTVLTAQKLTSSGRLEIPPRAVFKQWAAPVAGSKHSIPDDEAMTIVVPADSLKAIFNFVVEEMAAVGGLSGAPTWDVAPPLPPAVERSILDLRKQTQRRLTYRKNSKRAKLDRFRTAVDELEKRAGQQGVPFDRDCLPIQRRELYAALCKIDGRLKSTSFGTFDDYYASNLGIRLRLGAKREEGRPLLRLVGLTLSDAI